MMGVLKNLNGKTERRTVSKLYLNLSPLIRGHQLASGRNHEKFSDLFYKNSLYFKCICTC